MPMSASEGKLEPGGNFNSKRAMGWLPDLPDFRDYSEKHPEITQILEEGEKAGRLRRGRRAEELLAVPFSQSFAASELPPAVDLRSYCSPVEDQGNLGSCTAHAGVGLIEYYERRAFGRHTDASRLFLYKVTRNLMKLRGDSGAYLRTTMGAMVLFGVPPESYWPYTDKEESFDREPSAFCYAFAQNYQTIKYFRHDPAGAKPADVLHSLKVYLAKGMPFIFGFSVYNSIEQAEATGFIPFPSKRERMEGGHAVMAVGYDDKLEITNNFSHEKTKGALLIRNSWGTGWGDHGYGWLPYEYVLRGLAEDFWSILKKEWVDTSAFAE